MLIEFKLPDDTPESAEALLKALSDAYELDALPVSDWRDVDVGQLRLVSEPMHDQPDGVTSLHSTLRVRDDLGRELDVAGLAYGPPCSESWPWMVEAKAGDPYPSSDEIIVSKRPLDASKTYLVIVIEHPDEVRRG